MEKYIKRKLNCLYAPTNIIHFVSKSKGTAYYCQLAVFAAGSLANWADENKGKETLGKWRVLHWMSMPVGRWSIFVQTEIKKIKES